MILIVGYIASSILLLVILSQMDIFSLVQPSQAENDPDSPTIINAFQLIGMSSCLDLSGFFEKEVGPSV